MHHLTRAIFIALALALVLGGVLHHLPQQHALLQTLLPILKWIGKLFLFIIKIIVVPVVFFSLAAGVSQLGAGARLGRMAIKTIALYLFTTAVAIAIALSIATLFHIGQRANPLPLITSIATTPLSLADNLKRVFISNPLYAFTGKNMLQLIIIAILIGMVIRSLNTRFPILQTTVSTINHWMMRLILWIMWIAPICIFALVTAVFAKQGFGFAGDLAGYFFTVIFATLIQWTLVYGSLLKLFTQRHVIDFYKKIRQVLLFAFSVSSSNATIPVTLETCEKKLKISNETASFVIPLGATINMDGTAVMQGVATVFIAHLYGVTLGISGYLLVIITATLASIGAAGVPSVGLITLAMVFRQVGLPLEGITMIIGIDRLLDMIRTAVNVTGDCVVASIVDT